MGQPIQEFESLPLRQASTSSRVVAVLARLLVIAFSVLLAGCGATQKAPVPTNDEQQAIRNEVDAFSKAWSAGDAKGAASFFTEDGVRVGATGATS